MQFYYYKSPYLWPKKSPIFSEKYGNNDNYYLKKHIINIFESQYKYKNSINEQFSEYFDRNYIKMEYVEETMKKLYSSKLQEILTNNFEYYLKDLEI